MSFSQQGGHRGPKEFQCNIVPLIRFHLRVALTFKMLKTGPILTFSKLIVPAGR